MVRALGALASALAISLMTASAQAQSGQPTGLPPGVFPVAGLTLGWPAARNAPSPRLPQSVVVHRERYDDGGLEAALPAYDALRPPAKPRYPEIHGPAPEGCRWRTPRRRIRGSPR